MSGNPIPFATVEEALEEIRQGRQIVLVDDEDRETKATSRWRRRRSRTKPVNFMARYGRGSSACPD